MYKLNFILILAALFFLISCNNSGGPAPTVEGVDLTGFTARDLNGVDGQVVIKKDEDGNIIEKGFVVNGKKEGMWTTYSKEGKILSVVGYVGGVKNGEELKFNTRSQLESSISYTNNQLDGIWSLYKNGRLTQQVSYKNGEFDGPTRMFFNSGKIQKEINFKNGKQDGLMRYYNEDGGVTLEYEYKNGKKVKGGIVEK